jgi:hypothetical protein
MDQIRDSDIDIGTFAGEFRETAEMFKTFSVALSRAARAARRGNLLEVARALGLRPSSSKDFANGWLMINYGVRPFVSDLMGACTALQKGLLKERFVMVHASAVLDDSKVTSNGVINSAGGRVQTTWTNKIQVSGRLKFEITGSTGATLASLGLTNPLAVGWELTKLSFVFDWAIGIGSWLGQLDSSFGKHFTSGSITTFTKYRGDQVWERMYVNASGYGGSSQANGVYEDVSVSRASLSTWPVNYLPAFKDPRSNMHIITSLSLLRQRY